MSERGITVNVTKAVGYTTTTEFVTDDEILQDFPGGDGSLVNPLLRRAQSAERERDEAREAAREFWDGGFFYDALSKEAVLDRLPWLASEKGETP